MSENGDKCPPEDEVKSQNSLLWYYRYYINKQQILTFWIILNYSLILIVDSYFSVSWLSLNVPEGKWRCHSEGIFTVKGTILMVFRAATVTQWTNWATDDDKMKMHRKVTLWPPQIYLISAAWALMCVYMCVWGCSWCGVYIFYTAPCFQPLCCFYSAADSVRSVSGYFIYVD